MKITTLEKVFNRVDALSQNCFDQNVYVKDISFENLDSVNIAGESHPLRTIAQRSIAWRLGIPFQYLRKCPSEIQSVNLNYWIEHEKNEQLFFRMDGQDVRAIFTPKYKPVDNFEVCERLDSMGYGPETQVQCSLDPEFMSLSIPRPLAAGSFIVHWDLVFISQVQNSTTQVTFQDCKLAIRNPHSG